MQGWGGYETMRETDRQIGGEGEMGKASVYGGNRDGQAGGVGGWVGLWVN